MVATLDSRRGAAESSHAVAPATMARALKEQLSRLVILKVEKGRKASAADIERREQADGFRVGRELYVKPKCWNGITGANKDVLIRHKILRTEREDTTTMARKVGGVKGKLRYIVLDTIALEALVRAENP